MYEQFMKSKIANRWGTSFKNVVSEEIPVQKESVTTGKEEIGSKQSSSLSVKTTTKIKNVQTSTY